MLQADYARDNNTALPTMLPFYRMATVTGLVSRGGLWSDADAAAPWESPSVL